jgi:hypothetical protein
MKQTNTRPRPTHAAALTRARYQPAPSRQPLRLERPDWLPTPTPEVLDYRSPEIVQPLAQLAAVFDLPPFGEVKSEISEIKSPGLVADWDYDAALARQAERQASQRAAAEAEAVLNQARAQAAAEVRAAAELTLCATAESTPLAGWTPSMVWSAVFGLTLGTGTLAGGAWLVWQIALHG